MRFDAEKDAWVCAHGERQRVRSSWMQALALALMAAGLLALMEVETPLPQRTRVLAAQVP